MRIADCLVRNDLSEASLRCAIGRIYYAVFHAARLSLRIQGRRNIHNRVIAELTKYDRLAGMELRAIRDLRNVADYRLASDSPPTDWRRSCRVARRSAGTYSKGSHEGSTQRLRQDRAGRAGARAQRGGLRACQHRWHCTRYRGRGSAGYAGRRPHRLAGDTRWEGQDPAPDDPRGHPRQTRPRIPPRRAGQARHRSHRRCGGQSLPVRSGGERGRSFNRNRAGEHRHRRAGHDPRRRQELSVRDRLGIAVRLWLGG